jgi:hypothetical protein
VRWTTLRGEAAVGADSLAVSSLSISTGYGPARLSLDLQGRAQLLLPVAPGSRRPSLDTPPALEIGASSFRDGVQSRT